MKIKILLVDDHTMVREGLRLLLESELDMTVVGEASNGNQSLELIQNHAPDVVLMDISMPDLDGIEATRMIASRFPKVSILILTMHRETFFINQAFQAGAQGYILKDNACEELLQAIRSAKKGEKYLSPNLSQPQEFLPSPSEKGPSPPTTLTSREREVLQSLADGSNTKQIAANLGLSVKTIECHRQNIMKKIQLNNIASLTKFAIRSGITTIDS
jgi:DNA-binding NarL/FixJ family response regulator